MSSLPPAKFRFERIEKKFRMTDDQYRALLPVLEEHFKRDSYGEVIICSIYYDTPDYAMIRRSIERPPFKEKLRLRSYGIPAETDMVFVEIKRKLNGIGYKRRIRVPFSEAKRLLRGEPIQCDDPQIEQELLQLVARYRPQPMVLLTYRRYAMTAKDDPELRLTVDRDLRYRLRDPESPGEDGTEPVMDDAFSVLMELKALGAIPMWLTDELSRLRIYQAPFSKIGTCYTRHIAPGYSKNRTYNRP